jgi:hypothetical protein
LGGDIMAMVMRDFRGSAAAILIVGSLLSPMLVAGRPDAQAAAPPRVQASDLVYIGAFRLPTGGDNEHTFKYGGRGLAFDARSQGLWLIGHDQQQWIAEVGIPAPSSSTTLADLPRAALLQDWRDRLAGSMGPIGQSGIFVGGILPWGDGDGLVASGYIYYDASKKQKTTHVLVGADGAVSGPYRVGKTPGLTGGYMAPIPAEWQAALGGPALTGQCCIPIISRTSYGPSATVFDPAKLADQDDAKLVVGYPDAHHSLGGYYDTDVSHLFLMSTAMGGVIFPPGTSSVLFVGVQPGSSCYGKGTSDRAQDRQPFNGTIYCYDPTNHYKGTHGYPYRGFVWAYDANDLVQVKRGHKRPWNLKPYATWTLDAPFMSHARTAILGATYDPATRRVFASLGFADGTAPVVAVYQLSVKPSPEASRRR